MAVLNVKSFFQCSFLLNKLLLKPRQKLQHFSRLYSAIKGVHNNREKTMLHVHWEDGDSCAYPFIFLRENCSCPKCIHFSSKGRVIDLFVKGSPYTFEPVQTSVERGKVLIKWTDGHTSSFPNNWLLERKFPKSMDDVKPKTQFGLEAITWNRKMLNENFPIFDYNLLSLNDLNKMKLIESLILYGVCLIEGAPKQFGSLDKISQLIGIGYLKNTYYG